VHIARIEVWVKLSDACPKRLANGTYRIPTFDKVKLINGKEYGRFDSFVDLAKGRMEEN
jgi:hypothetical protein